MESALNSPFSPSSSAKPMPLGPVEGDDAVGDLDRLQRDVGRHERQRARARWRSCASCRRPRRRRRGAAPAVSSSISLASMMPLSSGGTDSRMVKLSARKNGSPVVPRRVGDAQLLEAHVGRRQQADVDVATDAHLAAEDARRLLLEDAAVAVPVDEVGNGEQRREGERDQPRDVKKPVAHLAFQKSDRRAATSAETASPAAPNAGLPACLAIGRAADAKRTCYGPFSVLRSVGAHSSLFAFPCLDHDPETISRRDHRKMAKRVQD